MLGTYRVYIVTTENELGLADHSLEFKYTYIMLSKCILGQHCDNYVPCADNPCGMYRNCTPIDMVTYTAGNEVGSPYTCSGCIAGYEEDSTTAKCAGKNQGNMI